MTVDHKIMQRSVAVRRLPRLRRWGPTCPSRCNGWLRQARSPTCCIRSSRRRCCRSSHRDHTRYRKLVSSVFTTQSRCRTAGPGAGRRQHASRRSRRRTPARVDIVDSYCSQLPVTVIGDILGVPDDARPRILEFGELGAPSLDIGLTWRQYQAGLPRHRGVQRLAVQPSARAAPQSRRRPDEPDHPASERAEGGPLTHEELLATAGLVLAAGFETTVNLLGQRDSDAARHPRAPRDAGGPTRVVADRGRRDPAAGVAGSAECPHRRPRTPTSRAPRSGRGEGVILYLAGANRDPKVFPDPHRFDIERENAGKHLSFSGGRHFCLGAALARAEGEVGLRTFFERFPDARLAGDGNRRETRVLRGWSSLPITLGTARAAVNS